MRPAPGHFDTPELYTTPWTAPYGTSLSQWRRSLGWEDTPTGAILALGLEQRGLTENHVRIATNGNTIMVSWPECIGPAVPVVVPAHEPPADPRELQRLLDMCTASVARETLMRHAGWEPQDAQGWAIRPPAWSLLTTPILEALLATIAVDSHRVWSLARDDGEFDVTFSPVSEQISLRRHGASLLITWAEAAPGVFVSQDSDTSIQIREPANVEAAKTLRPGMRIGDALDVSASPIADILAGLVVRDTWTNPEGTAVILHVGMPMIGMAPMPGELRSRFVGREIGDDELGFPLWATVGSIEWPGAQPAAFAGPTGATPQGGAAELADVLSSVPDVQKSVMATFGRQPAHLQGEFAGRLTHFFAHRLRHEAALTALAQEHPVIAATWCSHYLHHLAPGAEPVVQGVLPGDPTFGEAQRTLRILRLVYDDLTSAGVREDSPFDAGQRAAAGIVNGMSKLRIGER